MKATVNITGTGEVKTLLDSVRRELDGGGLMQSINTALTAAVKENFVRLNQKPNKLGGTRTNYWLNASDATVSRVEGRKALIECAHIGVALHLHGGTVKPTGRTSEITGKPIRYLSIPVDAMAHGKSIATLRALGVRTYRAGGAIFQHPGLGAKVNPDADKKLYVLAKQATIKADPTVLPSEQALAEAAADAGRDYLAAKGLA